MVHELYFKSGANRMQQQSSELKACWCTNVYERVTTNTAYCILGPIVTD